MHRPSASQNREQDAQINGALMPTCQKRNHNGNNFNGANLWDYCFVSTDVISQQSIVISKKISPVARHSPCLCPRVASVFLTLTWGKEDSGAECLFPFCIVAPVYLPGQCRRCAARPVQELLSPSAFASAACRSSKVQKRSAPSASAEATCRLSNVRIPRRAPCR